MGKNLDMIKGMVGVTVGAVLAGTAMRAVGGVSAMSSGMRGATQSLIGVGLVGHAASLSKKVFKWK